MKSKTLNIKLNNRGFSLIELMVVVAIIGILSAIGIPQYSKFQAKTRQSEAKSALGTLFTAEKSFQIEWNHFTRDIRNAGFGIEGQTLRYNAGFPGVASIASYTGLANAPTEADARRVVQTADLTLNGATNAWAVAPPGFDTYAATNAASYGPALFTAVAWGSPNSGTVACVAGVVTSTRCDEWRITEGKQLSNPQNGIW